MTLDNLVGMSLETITPDPLTIRRLLDAAKRNLQDAKLNQLSNENRFDVAYKAIMQMANAALQSRGFRTLTSKPGHHQTMIQSLPKTLDVSHQQMIILDALRKQQPRLYSIASSQAEVGDEVHLTLGVVRYDAFGDTHLGGASGFLAERLEDGAQLKVFVEHNDNFRLPDHETPVIMIGPGTGIAPFRAFLQERDQAGATGQNWLFFGNPHFTQDFLYQVELQDYLKRGVLSKLDVAFSRDQAQKVYVQDKLRLKAEEIWTWLQQGAYLYICGDGNKMAKDVHQALLDIAQQQAGLNAEEAEQYFDDLRQAKRYQKDVY